MIYFTRLAYNENRWEFPIKHTWKIANQNRKGIAFEKQFGYGHEEWLLNPRYRIKNYQYGYIRGIDKASAIHQSIEELHLFTITDSKQGSKVFYLGYISNIEFIKNNDRELKKINKIIELHKESMMQEIKSIDGDPTNLRKAPHRAVVKFKVEDIHLLDEPQIQPEFKKNNYHRYLLYSANNFSDVFNVEAEDSDTLFNPGKANQVEAFTQNRSASSNRIQKFHTQIINELEKHLHHKYSKKRGNISIEKTRFKGKVADLVTKDENNTLDIYEIKTTYSGRLAMREALSQLLDYALNSNGYEIKRLIIVSPAVLTQREIHLLERYNDVIDYEIQYLQYSDSYESKFKLI